MKITLTDEIRAAEKVVEMYRRSWFMPSRRGQNWHWAGEPEQWREWLAANAILRRLKRIRASVKRNARSMTATREACKRLRKKRGRPLPPTSAREAVVE